MKKLFLLFVAVMFGFAGNAQDGTFTRSGMSAIVSAAKYTYTKGLTYKEWLESQSVNAEKITKVEDKFFSDVFGFISTGASPETVLKSYDGRSLMDLAELNSKGGMNSFTEATNENRICIWCILKVLIDVACHIVNCEFPSTVATLP